VPLGGKLESGPPPQTAPGGQPLGKDNITTYRFDCLDLAGIVWGVMATHEVQGGHHPSGHAGGRAKTSALRDRI